MFYFRRPMIYLVFISLMIPKSLFAANITDTLSLNLCPKNSACSPTFGLMKQTLSFCEISKKTFQCDEFVKKNPEFATLVQKCDANSYCTQNMEVLLNNQAA